MLNKSKKQKGKKLEKFVSQKLQEIFPTCYSRADSGSGKYHKEDVTLPFNVPLHIECKNQASLNLKGWWAQTVEGCPAEKFPVLIYKLDYQKQPTVVMYFGDICNYLVSTHNDSFNYQMSFTFDDFIALVKDAERLHSQ